MAYKIADLAKLFFVPAEDDNGAIIPDYHKCRVCPISKKPFKQKEGTGYSNLGQHVKQLHKDLIDEIVDRTLLAEQIDIIVSKNATGAMFKGIKGSKRTALMALDNLVSKKSHIEPPIFDIGEIIESPALPLPPLESLFDSVDFTSYARSDRVCGDDWKVGRDHNTDFEVLREFPAIRHDCHEDHMRALITNRHGLDGIVAHWEEGSTKAGSEQFVRHYDDAAVPASLSQWNSFCTVQPTVAPRIKCNYFDKSLVFRSIQTTQRLLNDWSPHVAFAHNLYSLQTIVDRAQVYGRMLFVICGGERQLDTLWIPAFTAEFGTATPRLMIAAIANSTANDHYNSEITERLLGFPQIDGLAFASHVKGTVARAFSANNVKTKDIFAALKTRYQVAVATGDMAPLEKGGMETILSVNTTNAMKALDNLCLIAPVKKTYSFSFEDCRAIIEDENTLLPADGITIKDNRDYPAAPNPADFTIELRQEQAKSLSFMMQQEQTAVAFSGTVDHRAAANVPPLHHLVVHWRLSLLYVLRGGVLCDDIGFGKTATLISLVASTKCDSLPPRDTTLFPNHLITCNATLVVLPNHLLQQWEQEIIKFVGKSLKVICIKSKSDVPRVSQVKKADIVLVSHTLFDSIPYQAEFLHLRINHHPNEDKVTSRDRQYLRALDGVARNLPPDSDRRRDLDEQRALEMYLWKRVCMDEIHELSHALSAVGGQWTLPLRCLYAHYRWGLTGTPPIHDLESIHNLGLLMGVNIGNTVAAAEAFVSSFLCSSKLQDSNFLPPITRNLFINLSVSEMALYRQLRHEYASELREGSGKAHQVLFQQCSYTNGGLGGAIAPEDVILEGKAGTELSRLMHQKKRKLASLRDKLDDKEKQIAHMDVRIKTLEEDGNIFGGQRRERMAALIGSREELYDKRREINTEIEAISRSLDYFQNTMSKLHSAESNLGECPICYEEMELEGNHGATITVCGHLQCLSCSSQLFEKIRPLQTLPCITCRTELRKEDWKLVTPEDLTAEDEASPMLEGQSNEPARFNGLPKISAIDKRYSKYGTKICQVVSQMFSIFEDDPDAKILIYCQWASLRGCIETALDDFKVKYVSLLGNNEVLKNCIEKFKKPRSVDKPYANVMVCSLEQKAAGLNLQVANHIMLVHPFFAYKNPRQCLAWEKQAIGRVARPGQTQQVFVWRFVALSTIEQELLVKQNMQLTDARVVEQN